MKLLPRAVWEDDNELGMPKYIIDSKHFMYQLLPSRGIHRGIHDTNLIPVKEWCLRHPEQEL